jgi:acyl-CoA thioester hydrolase
MVEVTGHTRTFTAGPEHIDVLGHVNNVVWVQWMEALATSHWEALAPAAWQDAYVWVVTRHEIDYRGNIALGESVTGETFVPDPPRGARFDRRVDFRPETGKSAGKVIVSARTQWVLIEKASGRIQRVPAEMAALFTA